MKNNYNKLVRDKIPNIIISNNGRPIIRKLKIQEFKKALRDKLVEEAQELKLARSCEEIINEIADVMEVVDSIIKIHSFSMSDIESAKLCKKRNRGGFDKMIMLESVEE